MSLEKSYRPLHETEIEVLTGQGCRVFDWKQIEVAEGFDPSYIQNVHFSGKVRIGLFDRPAVQDKGIVRPVGLYGLRVQDVTIGDNVRISGIRDILANYVIGDDVWIEDVACLECDGQSCFGNGTEASVVNENGRRSIPLFERLSAQLAYLLAMYRHRPKLIERLRHLVADAVEGLQKPTGRVEAGARILHCGVIRNVNIGPAAVLDGAAHLENGTIRSCAEDPAFVGPGVIANDFVFCEGSRVRNHVIVRRCFVGQSTELSRSFTAQDSVFFANSSMGQGQAYSMLAGPFSVSQHKSTLLIAGLCSFFNAGSGSNQSNHMYRLGPNQQGVLERGVKTGSGSYLAWPARIGAFSVVIGRHIGNPDTSDFPFSYLVERMGRSVLYPGLNLVNIGLIRDRIKWQQRDQRKAPVKLDAVNPDVMTPYLVRKLKRGIQMLEHLTRKISSHPESILHQGLRVYMAERGLEIYRWSVRQYFGRVLIRRLSERKFISLIDLRNKLETSVELGEGDWVDCAGLIAPASVIETLLLDIEEERIDTVDAVQVRFHALLEHYGEYEWAWVKENLEQELGKPVREWDVKDIVSILEGAQAASQQIVHSQIEDAKREFERPMRTGYGIDQPQTHADDDFAAVCGSLEEDEVIRRFQSQLDQEGKTIKGLKEKLAALH